MITDFPQIVFFDLEGTLLRKDVTLDYGHVAPSTWVAVAEALGPECLEEEKASQQKWLNGEYAGYVEWMQDTIRIHQKYSLTREMFYRVVDAVELTSGVEEAVRVVKETGAGTAIISGGFKALADRVQRLLRIDHALCGCEYFFDERTGLIEHYNLLPSDEAGKVSFMRLIAEEHGVKAEECVFVGDGKNDVPLAKAVGFSIAFNAQPELREHADACVDQGEGSNDFGEVADVILRERQRRTGSMTEQTAVLNVEAIMNLDKLPADKRELVDSALGARNSAYAPYSSFAVGAAVRTGNDDIYTGCNVENASYGATMCAERVAVFNAVSAGHTTFTEIAVVADYSEPLPPCGMCRQVIAEFAPSAVVIMANTNGAARVSSMGELFPSAFDLGKRVD